MYEAAPLASIAGFVGPMSHGICRPVCDSVLELRSEWFRTTSRASLLDIESPAQQHGLTASASYFFGDRDGAVGPFGQRARTTGVATAGLQPNLSQAAVRLDAIRRYRPGDVGKKQGRRVSQGFQAIKIGWGPFGRHSAKTDADHLHAAREGLGPEGLVCIDAGQIWGDDVEAAATRLPALKAIHAHWLEEPFKTSALESYRALSTRSPKIRLAGGEGAHNYHMARHMIDYGKVGFIQIDCGRIGGIGPAKRVADYAAARGVTYVNHTFTSHLALSASLQPFAGLAEDRICEYPAAPKQLAVDLTTNHLLPDRNGEIHVPDAPGLGMTVNVGDLSKYLVDVEIVIQGSTIYKTPRLE